jgi:hypothetical protein
MELGEHLSSTELVSDCSMRDVVDLERGPLSLVNIVEELLGRKSRGSGLENREYGHRDPSR